MTDPDFVTMESLMQALPDVLAAPRTATPVLQLCFRPGFNQRSFPERLTLTRDAGVPGERFTTAPWLKGPDGRGDPRIQVSILPRRVMDLVWRDRIATPHPGDTIIADLETSEANLPAGTLLGIGSAVIRVSDVFNDGCVKWKARYGKDAKDWITAPGHPPLRLRGILCSVEQDGVIACGDLIHKLD